MPSNIFHAGLDNKFKELVNKSQCDILPWNDFWIPLVYKTQETAAVSWQGFCPWYQGGHLFGLDL